MFIQRKGVYWNKGETYTYLISRLFFFDKKSPLSKLWPLTVSAVARGRAQKVKTDLYKFLKIKLLSPERFETITFELLSFFF